MKEFKFICISAFFYTVLVFAHDVRHIDSYYVITLIHWNASFLLLGMALLFKLMLDRPLNDLLDVTALAVCSSVFWHVVTIFDIPEFIPAAISVFLLGGMYKLSYEAVKS